MYDYVVLVLHNISVWGPITTSVRDSFVCWANVHSHSRRRRRRRCRLSCPPLLAPSGMPYGQDRHIILLISVVE
jgi:hypothetical protein